MVLLSYFLRRTLRHWQFYLILYIGMILGTMLLASSPLLVNAVLEFTLREKILTADALDKNLTINTYELTQQSTIESLDLQVRHELESNLGNYLDRVVFGVTSTWMVPWIEGKQNLDDRINLAFYDGLQDEVEFVSGQWPEVGLPISEAIPMVIGEAMARAYDLEIGDRLPLSRVGNEVKPTVILRITGVIRARNPNGSYWFSALNPLTAQSRTAEEHSSGSYKFSAILLPENYFQSVASLLPGTESRLIWQLSIKPTQVDLAHITDLCRKIDRLKADLSLGKNQILVETGIKDLLQAFAVQSKMVRGPLYILMAEVVILVLYFTVMEAAVSVQQQEREFAMLNSRGASEKQILAMQTIEAILVGGIAFICGPTLATFFIQKITASGPIAGFRPPDWTAQLNWESWMAAGVGVGACILGLLLPVGATLRRSIISHQQNLVRPPGSSRWHRMYLDVILMSIGLILMWRFQMYSGQLTSNSTQVKVDWLLLLSPLALLLGAVTILLRVLPIILRLFANLANRGRGLIIALTLRQVSHNPTQVILLVLLLTLATSLAVLSTGLNATLDASELERAQYAVGGNVRFITNAPPDIPSLSKKPEVEAASAIFRNEGTVDIGSFRSYPRFEILAIDAKTVKGLGNFRKDFADRPMGEMFDLLVVNENMSSRLIKLPGKPTSLGLWLWSMQDKNFNTRRYWYPLKGNNDLDRIRLRAKLKEASGEFITVELGQQLHADCPLSCCIDCFHDTSFTEPGKENSGEWRFFYALLPELPADSYPLHLHSIWFDCIAVDEDGKPAAIDYQFVIDDLTVGEGGVGSIQVIDSFDRVDRVWNLDMPGVLSKEDIVNSKRLEGNFLSVKVLRNYEHKPIALKILNRSSTKNEYSETALPALASPSFFQASKLAPGQTATAWIASLPTINFILAGKLNYFPTLYEGISTKGSSFRDAGFLLTTREALLMRLNDRTPESINPNEVWLSTNGELTEERLVSFLPMIEETWELDAIHNSIKADPMALGMRSVIFYGYLTVSALSVVGFATNFYMTARRRATIYAVLRTIGMSSWQLYAMLILEQVILVLSGFLLGSFLGILLNKIALPGLPVTLGDLPPIPPFHPQDDWNAVMRIYALLGMIFLVSISIVTTLLWRARLHRVLRIGEE